MDAVTEGPSVNHLTGTVTFSRKVSVRQYESAEASIFVQFEIPNEGSPEQQRAELLANARAAYFSAKALVFQELGLEFTVGEDGVIHEVLQKNFGKVTDVTPTELAAVAMDSQTSATPFAEPTATEPNAPYAVDTQDKNERNANKRWAVARIASHPDEWWDNRQNKRNPKAPDYKHKETGMGVWL
jgi:hypothetical protein